MSEFNDRSDMETMRESALKKEISKESQGMDMEMGGNMSQ